MGVDMSNDPPPTSHTKDFFASPALSLSLVRIFRHAAAAATSSKEGEETVEIISSEGHTADQIREMEALFKESPHPDEKQRQQLSKQLGLAPRQVKFWFQNRRTQIKAIQERHENSLLKSEIEKLREENKSMRDTINKACCPNCGMPTTSRDPTEEQQLRIENAKLKSEVEKLRVALGKYPGGGTTSCSPSCSGSGNTNNNNNNNEQDENRSSLDFYTGIFGLDKSRIMEILNQALHELLKMGTAGEPLWIRSVETGRDILNYDEYVKEFGVNDNNAHDSKRSIEASRDTGVVFVDLPRLIHKFLDVNQWKEMFPCLISKAATVDVICNGEGANRDGAVQLVRNS
ncbi:homeobox-leucine zipper protein GLABRA 2 [Senna tora]|uniref:Homeobox-leucine zipper protein GLABRA 2 n=1 Tax=Senna tora TaxID=362788 RepID=A0A835CLF7_9FABA|nr:homeobox-leucine zipper protein GLABRA 2 [Senna tora]